VKPEEVKGLYLQGAIGGRSYSVMVLDVRVWHTQESPEAPPIEMWTLTFQGVAQGWVIGPWLVDVEASKATKDTIRMAVEDTIRGMMGW
jgi:hypothetical protein